MSKIVDRTLDFLELFAEQRRPLSLSEISKCLSLPASSCHDVIKALQGRGYVYEVSPRGGYYPTLRLHQIALAIVAADPILQRVEHHLAALRDATDEFVLLARTSGLKAFYIMALEPSHPLRFLARAGEEVRHIHATSAGKALLGHLPREKLEIFLESHALMRLTPYTATTKEELQRDIVQSRQRGWYLNQDATIEGVTTISAYLFPFECPLYRYNCRNDASPRSTFGKDRKPAVGDLQPP